MTNQTITGVSDETRAQAMAEFEQLLLGTCRHGVKSLIKWLKTSSFYYDPASVRYHGSFGSGLLCHSLNTYNNAHELNNNNELPNDSIVLSSLLHDMCKCGSYKRIGGKWCKNHDISIEGHGRRSLTMLKNLGLDLTNEEQIAIRWHMKHTDSDLKYSPADSDYRREYEAIKRESHPLLDVIFKADYKASKDEPLAQKARLYCPLSYITVNYQTDNFSPKCG